MHTSRRLLILTLLMMVCTFFFSCSDDKECTLKDWVGLYKGIKTCGSNIRVDYIFEIRLPEEGLDLPSNTIILDGLYFTVVNCEPESALLATLQDEVSGKLEGDKIVFTHNALFSSCSWSAIKQ